MSHAADIAPKHRVAVGALVAIASLGALAACNSVLGLDTPTLDPCADVACADGAASDAGSDGDAAGSKDATPDRGATNGLRCGGGTFAQSGCDGSTPLCCQTGDDAGAMYSCVANAGACTGYPIACTSNADCNGNDVCCHSSSQIKCVMSSACTDDALVCEPGGLADQCPNGWTCKAMFTNDGVASPYFGCAP